MANAGKYARNAVLTVFETIGGVERMAEWAEDNPGEFYTKLFAKTITRDNEHTVSDGVEDLLDRLDKAEQSEMKELESAIDADFELVDNGG